MTSSKSSKKFYCKGRKYGRVMRSLKILLRLNIKITLAFY